MAQKRITDLAAASALTGAELVEVSQLSDTVAITAATISAAASDNSYNDSANGFVAAGFAEGDRVNVAGFTGDVANNILVGIVTALTTGKMTIGGTDGDVIVDDAAGESVTITKWVSRRTTTQDIGDLGGGGAGGKYRVGFSIENEEPVSGEVLLRHVFTEDVDYADDFAGSVARLSPGGSNPATNQVFDISHNGSSVGSLTISSAGAITWATTGGALAVVAGDEITIEAPAAPDAALVGVSATLYGIEA